MAEVFSGHSIGDHGFQKPVAIKRLLPELANDHVFVDRLIDEAKLLVGMQHGNIVSVLDLARDGDDVFLVMEFVDGPSLRQLLKTRGQRGLPLGVATYIVQSAAAGLAFAHGRPGGAIVHADISPSNILLTTSGEVRVADFGIARREGGGHGIVEGKWAYMAPEQARGEPLTPRSDVFALGVVLYELICGAHPFGRQVTAEERDSEPMRVIPPRVVRPSIPHGIDAICMRALAHDPRDRYRGMQQLIDAIVEERFTNQWREGASDLAHAIRECNPQAAAMHPRTMVTERPVTIATRSLLKELTPARRGSRSDVSRSEELSRSIYSGYSESIEPSQPARAPRGTPPPPSMVADSGARTTALLAEDVMRAAALMELPPLLRADGTPMPPFKLSEALAPGQDLASVVGGHTHSQHVGSMVVGDGRSTLRWTIIVLLVAAVIGAIAAFVIAGHGEPPAIPTDTKPLQIAPTPPVAPAQTPAVTDDHHLATPGDPAIADKPTTDKPVTDTPSTDTPADDTTDKPATEAPGATDGPTAAVAPDQAKPDDKNPPTEDDQDKTRDKGNKPPRGKTDGAGRPDRARPRKEPGILRVNSAPGWSYVTVAGQRQTTVAKFTLPPGKYTVKFQTPDKTRTLVKTATVESGKVTPLYANLEEDY